MDKNTKLLLGIALVGAGAYMLWFKNQKKMSYIGNPVGRRMRMSGGKMNASGLKGLKMKTFVPNQQLPVHDSGWQGADGGFKATKEENVFKGYAGTGFTSDNTKIFSADGSEKIFSADGTGKFFKPHDSGWQG